MRGAIACNYIGLRDKEIARMWLGIVPASHYDNRKYTWGMSQAERKRGVERLKRLWDTPQYVCGEHHLAVDHRDKKLLEMVREKKFSSLEAAKSELKLPPHDRTGGHCRMTCQILMLHAIRKVRRKSQIEIRKVHYKGAIVGHFYYFA